MLSSQFENIILEYKQDITAQKMGDPLIAQFFKDIETHPDRDLANPSTQKIIDALKKAESLTTSSNRNDGEMPTKDEINKLEEKIAVLKNQLAVKVLLGFEGIDPTPNKKYVQWLARTYINNPTLYSMEDILSTMRDYLHKFHRLKVKNHLTKKTDHPEGKDLYDINTFKSFDNFMDELDTYSNQLVDDDDGKKKTIYNHNRVHDENGLLVIHPKDRKAACHYGQGTRWCTSAQNNNFFAGYNRRGNLYMVMPRKPSHVGEKYQFHFEDGAFYDEKDHSMGEAELFALSAKYPEIKKVPIFKKQAEERGLLWLQEPKKKYSATNFTVEEYRKNEKPLYIMRGDGDGDGTFYALSKKQEWNRKDQRHEEGSSYTIEKFSDGPRGRDGILNAIEEHAFLKKYPELATKFDLEGTHIQPDPKRLTTKAGSDVEQHAQTSIMTDKNTGHRTAITLKDLDIDDFNKNNTRAGRHGAGPLNVIGTNPFGKGERLSTGLIMNDEDKHQNVNPYELTLEHPELIDLYSKRVKDIMAKATKKAKDYGYTSKSDIEKLQTRMYRAIAPLLPYQLYDKEDVLLKRHVTPKGKIIADYIIPKDTTNPNVTIITRDNAEDIESINVIEPKKMHYFSNTGIDGEAEDYKARTTDGKIYGDVSKDPKLRRMYNDKIIATANGESPGLSFLPSIAYLNKNPTLLDLYKDSRMASPKEKELSTSNLKDYGKSAYVGDTSSYNADTDLKTLRNYIVEPKEAEDGESYAISWSPEKPQYAEAWHITKNGQQQPIKDHQTLSHVMKMFPEIRKLHMKDFNQMRKKNPEYEPTTFGGHSGYRRDTYIPDWDFMPTEVFENDKVKIEQFGPRVGDTHAMPGFQVFPKQKNPFGKVGDRFLVRLTAKDRRGDVGKVGSMEIKRFGKSTHVNVPVDEYGNETQDGRGNTAVDTKSVPNVTTMQQKDEMDFFKYYPELRRMIKDEYIHKTASPASLQMKPPKEEEEVEDTTVQYSNFKLDTVPIADPIITKQYIIPNEEEYDDEFYTLYTYDPSPIVSDKTKIVPHMQNNMDPYGATQLVKGEAQQQARYYGRQQNDNSSGFREAFRGRHEGTISPNTPEYNKLMQRFPDLNQLMSEKSEAIGDIRTQKLSDEDITIVGPERVYTFKNIDGSERYVITPVSNPVRGQPGEIKDLHDIEDNNPLPSRTVSRVQNFDPGQKRKLAGGEEDWDDSEIKWNRDSYEIDFQSTENNRMLQIPLLVDPFIDKVKSQVPDLGDDEKNNELIDAFSPMIRQYPGRNFDEKENVVNESKKNPELYDWLVKKAEEANAKTAGIGMFINFLPITTNQLTADQIDMTKVFGIDVVGIGKLGIKNPLYFWQGRQQNFDKIKNMGKDNQFNPGNERSGVPSEYHNAITGASEDEAENSDSSVTNSNNQKFWQHQAKDKLIVIKPEAGTKFMDAGSGGYSNHPSGILHQIPSAKFINIAKKLPNVDKIVAPKDLKSMGMIPMRTWGPRQVKSLDGEPAVKNNGKPWIKSIEEFVEPDGLGINLASYGDDKPSKVLAPGTGYIVTLNSISDKEPNKKRVRDPETGKTTLQRQTSPARIVNRIGSRLDLPWDFTHEVLDWGKAETKFMIYFANNRVAYILNPSNRSHDQYKLNQDQKKRLFFDEEYGLFPELKPVFDQYAKSNKWLRENQIHAIMSKILFEGLGDKAYYELQKKKSKPNYGQLIFLKNIRLAGSYSNEQLKSMGFFMKNDSWAIQKPKYDRLVADGELREMSINRPLLTGKNKIPKVGIKKIAEEPLEEGKKFPRTSEFLYQKVDEVEDIKRLSGIYDNYQIPVHVEGATTASMGSNISQTASQISKIMKEKNIQPGTPEWFQLWFSKPYLTGEKPTGKE